MRTFEEIKQQMYDELAIQMPGLTSSSASSIYKVWINIVALAIFTHEQIFDYDKKNLLEETERRRYGTLSWYAGEALKFQNGETLTFNSDTGQYYYATVDEALQIVKKVAVFEDITDEHPLTFKVAKAGTGGLEPLDPTELIAFKNYIEEIKVAGTAIEYVSLPADTLTIQSEVFYDGNLLVPDLKLKIQAALELYQVNSPFSGAIVKNEIIDLLRDIDGINDVYFNTITNTSFGSSPVTIMRESYTTSGYFVYPDDMIETWVFTPKHI